jgi:hypothetical protein
VSISDLVVPSRSLTSFSIAIQLVSISRAVNFFKPAISVMFIVFGTIELTALVDIRDGTVSPGECRSRLSMWSRPRLITPGSASPFLGERSRSPDLRDGLAEYVPVAAKVSVAIETYRLRLTEITEISSQPRRSQRLYTQWDRILG